MKNLYSFAVLLFLSLAGTLTANAQGMAEQIGQHFRHFMSSPQEKLYLHLDKPYYAAGENIFFKAYLTDAIQHTSQVYSNFINVELIDECEKVIARKKIRRDENGFQGSLELAPEITPGEYDIRAYTQWMQNQDKAYFYTRKLHIGNALDKSIQSFIHYDSSNKNSKCQVTVRFTNEYNHPIKQTAVSGNVSNSGSQQEGGNFIRKTNEQGEIMFDIPINKSFRKRSINITFDDATYNYSRTFNVPPLGREMDEFSLSFFPEGGDLIANCNQRVAFKGLLPDGSNATVQGFIINEKGDTINTFQTSHDGMGLFLMNIPLGSKWTARASLDGTSFRDFQLPEVKAAGLQLSVMQRKNYISYSVIGTDKTALSDTLYLTGHTRGKLTLLIALGANNLTSKFSNDLLSDGITELLLTDKQGRVMSRRLVFKAPKEQLNLSVGDYPDMSTQRTKVSIPLRLTNPEGTPVQGTFSLSLTDKNLVQTDSLREHIITHFLLTSDLKGHVHNPAYYFAMPITSQVEYNTDLLMMTHGWSRFRHDNLAELPVLGFKYYIENAQFINGQSVNLVGGKMKNVQIVMMAPQQNITMFGQSDENGNFLINNLDFKDTLTFVAQARGKSRFAPAFLKVDSVPIPAPHYKYPLPRISAEDNRYLEYDKATSDSYIEEGGMRVIRLGEVTVTARKANSEQQGFYQGMGDTSYDEKALQRLGVVSSAAELLQRMPGIWYTGNKLTITRYQNPPLFIIDDMRYEEGLDILEMINASDVSHIDIVKGAQTSFFGSEGANGVIIVGIKKGVEIKAKPSPGLLLFTRFGYSDSMEFYHPVYETPEQKADTKKDIRSTVYWNPNLKTDENGQATIEFYTPDNKINPEISAEGILPDGTLLKHFQ